MTNRVAAPYTVDGKSGMSTNGRETGAFQVKSGLAQMLKGGGVMDVVTPEHARIAKAAVKAVTDYDDPGVIAEASRGLGEAMVGISARSIESKELLATRGW